VGIISNPDKSSKLYTVSENFQSYRKSEENSQLTLENVNN
jgi:hypothetical protein